MAIDWSLNQTDSVLLNDLQDFIPDRVFDAHAHIYDTHHYKLDQSVFWNAAPSMADVGFWNRTQQQMLGKAALCGGLLMPMPVDYQSVEPANAFLLQQLEGCSNVVGGVLIFPKQQPEKVENLLENNAIAALKPYHSLADTPDSFDLDIQEYLPDWAWEVAQRHGLAIVLHLVKPLALADPENSSYIVRKCKEHPQAKLILAHCGRAFCSDTAIKGLPILSQLDNIWFDCSAICELEPIEAVLWNFGPTKLMYGSDFPVSFQRAKAVTVGDGFQWVEGADNRFCSPALTGVESLKALAKACKSFGLDKEDIKDIFHDNAAELFGLQAKAQNITKNLYEHAKQRIPGGVQLLSKRPEMMAPGQWPAYFSEARGCEIWDLDGRHYFDMSTNGIGACLLGYRDADVTSAVKRRVNLGAMSTLNPPEEVYLADKLCQIHPWAQQVRFARTGGECASVAVRIARATTDRSIIAVCGYHGWQDWYLAANLGENDSLRGHLLPGLDPLGVPGELRDTTFTFKYENSDQLDAIISRAGNRLAAVIMEPCRHRDPKPGFLEYVRDACHACGALLIFDEITIGWRYTFGGSHLRFGVNPDIAIFAKALGNGHPIAAVIGTEQAMSGAHSSFISSTYWTESVGPAAALATLDKMQRFDVPAHVADIGKAVRKCWQISAGRYSLPIELDDGYPCLAQFSFQHPQANKLKTLFVQLMLERGFLAGPSIYPTLAHTPQVVEIYGKAVDAAFSIIAEAIAENNISERLKGPEAHVGFRRLV